jgi:CheY-like chemotaxis protein
MKPLRILVAEDDALIGMLLAELLVEMGHEVRGVAATEADAVIAAARHKPDLMILDARLGEGSGVAAIGTILRNGPMPHLFISGAPLVPPREDVVLLRKPFTEGELAHAIARVLGAAAAAGGHG